MAAPGRTGDTDVVGTLLGTTPQRGPAGTVLMKLGQCWVYGDNGEMCGKDAYTRAQFQGEDGRIIVGLVCPDHAEVGSNVELRRGEALPISREEIQDDLNHLVAEGKVIKNGNRYRAAPDAKAEWDRVRDEARKKAAGLSELERLLAPKPAGTIRHEGADGSGHSSLHNTVTGQLIDLPGTFDSARADLARRGLDALIDEATGNNEQAARAKARHDMIGAIQRVNETRDRMLRAALTIADDGDRLEDLSARAEAARQRGEEAMTAPGTIEERLARLEAAAREHEEVAAEFLAERDRRVFALKQAMVDPHKSERDSEAIAEVITAIANRKVIAAQHLPPEAFQHALGLWENPKIIDATPIYHQTIGKGEVRIYEDHPCIAPPFDEFAVCYRNQHGNVMVMHAVTADGREWSPAILDQWDTANGVDWDRVRWRMFVVMWLGGTDGTGRKVPVSGPYYAWKMAVYPDGEPADISWVDLGPTAGSDWDMAQLTLLGSLQYLNCRNVEVVEPRRSRGFAKRMARMGVKVGQIRVFPVGRSTRSDRGEGIAVGGDNPATPVRGHFAEYGVNGKGLLFGRYAGRFYISPHIRGNPDLGENENSYVLEAASVKASRLP